MRVVVAAQTNTGLLANFSTSKWINTGYRHVDRCLYLLRCSVSVWSHNCHSSWKRGSRWTNESARVKFRCIWRDWSVALVAQALLQFGIYSHLIWRAREWEKNAVRAYLKFIDSQNCEILIIRSESIQDDALAHLAWLDCVWIWMANAVLAEHFSTCKSSFSWKNELHLYLKWWTHLRLSFHLSSHCFSCGIVNANPRNVNLNV